MLTAGVQAAARMGRKVTRRPSVASRPCVVTMIALCVINAACASAPPYSGWTSDQLFAHGEAAYNEADWDEARRAFERLVLTFPDFSQLVDARHYLALTFFSAEQYVSAVSEYTRIVQVYPNHERTPEAWMGLCRSYALMSPHPQRDQQSTIQARTTCSEVAADFRGTAYGDSAAAVAQEMHDKLGEKAYQEGAFYLQRGVLESAEHVFLDLLEAFPDTEAAPRALARLVEIYREWNWADQVEEYRDRLLAAYPESIEARTLSEPAADTIPAGPSPSAEGRGARGRSPSRDDRG